MLIWKRCCFLTARGRLLDPGWQVAYWRAWEGSPGCGLPVLGEWRPLRGFLGVRCCARWGFMLGGSTLIE
jgi:hypothetical protein